MTWTVPSLFTEPVSDAHATLAIVLRVCCAGIAISCAETLTRTGLLKDGGLMSWEVGKVRDRWLMTGLRGRILDFLVSYPNVVVLLAVRLALALVIVSGLAGAALPWMLGGLVVLTGLWTVRNAYGLDGSDQMSWIIQVAVFLTALVPTRAVETVGVWFIALMACHSYVTAGLAKSSAKGWRSGSFLVGICRTRIYGHAGLARYLSAHPVACQWMACSVIAWESLFVLGLFAPPPFAMAMLVIGVGFHVANAFVMGLNTFVWAFLATYPAIWFCVLHRGW